MIAAAPGDVLAVWTGGGFIQNAIRLGAWLSGNPSAANHVVILTHQDNWGRWIGIEGRPGGVGPVDATWYLDDRRTRSNHLQPRDDSNAQMSRFLASAAASLGISYDWVGIAEDVAKSLHLINIDFMINPLWSTDKGKLPGHVVCSSLAAYLYDQPEIGWPHPDVGYEKVCTPADWWHWNNESKWA